MNLGYSSEAARLLHYLGQVGVAFASWNGPVGGKYDLCLTKVYSPFPVNDFAGAHMDGEWVVVAWIGHGAYAFKLLGKEQYWTPDYVKGALGGTIKDAESLAQLFNEIQAQHMMVAA